MGRKRKGNPSNIGKVSSGFPIKLTNAHRLTIHQTYTWLKSQGLWDEDTEVGIEAIPSFNEPIQQSMGDVDKVIKDGIRCTTYVRPATGYRDPLLTMVKTVTIRIRAEHIAPVVKLLRLVAVFVSYGQIGATLLSRADDLEAIPILDQLYDAQRGDSVSLTLKD